MIRRRPRSTRTYTLFPDTTLFRAALSVWLSTVSCSSALLLVALSFSPDKSLARPGWCCLPCRSCGGCASVTAVSDCRLRKARLVKGRSEEHTSELQSLMRISYAVFCLKKKKRLHTLKAYRQ